MATLLRTDLTLDTMILDTRIVMLDAVRTVDTLWTLDRDTN
jgi:hypothetical protein